MPDTTTQDTALSTPEEQANAATAGPQPLSAAIAGAPSPATAAAPAPAPPPKPSPQQQAAAADTAHHSAIGKIASMLLGKQRQYSVDPQTGQTVTTEVKEKPGDLFRHILAGAIMGGAAARGTNSPIAGFVRGGTAGIEANQAADQQRLDRAQQQFKNQQVVRTEAREDDRLKDEKKKTEAQLEMWNKETLLHDHEANLRVQEFHERHNASNQLIRDRVTESGGIDAPIPNNGEMGNGAKYEKLFVSQPELFKAPDGYNRVLTKDIDFDGVTWDAKKGYIDEAGNPLDLAKRTTWHIQFVPQKTPPIETTYGELYRNAPLAMGEIPKGVDPKAKVRMPVDKYIGVMTKQSELSRQEADEKHKATHDALAAQMQELKSKGDNFTRQANAAERVGDLDKADALRQQADAAYKKYDEVWAQTHPDSKERRLGDRNNPPPANNPPKVGDIKYRGTQKVRITKVNPDGTYSYQPQP